MKSSIFWKHFFSIFLVLILCVLVFYFNVSPIVEEIFTGRIEKELAHKSLIIKEKLDEKYLFDWDVDGIDQFVDDLAHRYEVRITLINEDGDVLADSIVDEVDFPKLDGYLEKPEIVASRLKDYAVVIRDSQVANDRLFYLAVKTPRGFVRVSVSMNIVESSLEKIDDKVAYSLIFAMLISALAGLMVSGSLSRSIKKILEITRRLSKGDLRHRLKPTSVDEMGQLATAINVMADNLQKQLEAIKSDQKSLRTILDSMVEGVVVTDKKGVILTYNPSFKEILGLHDDCRGKTFIEYYRHQKIQENIEGVLKEEKVKQTSIVLRDASGMDRYLMMHTAPLSVQTKGEKGSVSVFYDVTELKKLENIRKDFVANVSHELKTPLTSIRGYSETILTGEVDDPKVLNRFVEKIYKNSVHLQSLVEDILELSKIESGRLDLHISEIDARRFVLNIVGEFQDQADKKEIEIRVDIPNELPLLNADPGSLKHILSNLIDNAIKYSPEKSFIKVGIRSDVKSMKFTVSDNGIGISQEDLERIYERFYRVDKARSRAEGGTGLGLSIVKHLVQSHGGDVSVTSQKGRGSSFSFSLPLSLSESKK